MAPNPIRLRPGFALFIMAAAVICWAAESSYDHPNL